MPASACAARGSPTWARPDGRSPVPRVGRARYTTRCTRPAPGPPACWPRTSMRIEKRFPAHGHDLDTDTTPLDAGLGFAVRWDKDFVGREAPMRLEDRPPKQRLATIVFDDADAVPLGGEPIRLGERMIGKTTSAAFGYRIGRPVALAMIDPGRLAEAREQRVEGRYCRNAGIRRRDLRSRVRPWGYADASVIGGGHGDANCPIPTPARWLAPWETGTTHCRTHQAHRTGRVARCRRGVRSARARRHHKGNIDSLESDDPVFVLGFAVDGRLSR